MRVTIYNHPDQNRFQMYLSLEATKAIGKKDIVICVHNDVISIKPASISTKKYSTIAKGRLTSFISERTDIIGEYTLEKDDEFDDFILLPLNN